MKKFILTIMCCVIAAGAFQISASDNGITTTKRERNYIKEGNRLYAEKRYAEAEVAYKKALEENAANEVALFNLASTYIRQAGADNGNALIASADSIMKNLASQAQDISIAEKSFYNLGNMAFNKEDYKSSIDMYKNALRRNPDNDQARENLRMAQLKLQEQQDQQQNQDQDKDQNKDQDQEQNQDKQDQQQNQSDQNKDQQDQNKDNQDQQQNQNNKSDQNKDNQQQQQPQGGISDENAEKILKAMENEENATRRRVEAQKTNEEKRNASQRNIEKPW